MDNVHKEVVSPVETDQTETSSVSSSPDPPASGISPSDARASETTPKSRWFNQPLPVGIFILVATFLFQQCGWLDQQRFIAEQAQATAAKAQAQSTLEQVTVAVGKLLTASAIIVGAHEAKVNKPQLNDTIDRYHGLQIEWDQNEDLIKLRMRLMFLNPEIEPKWKTLLDKLEVLDAQILELSKFTTSDTSENHIQKLKQCREQIQDIELRLSALTQSMNDHIKATHSKPPEQKRWPFRWFY